MGRYDSSLNGPQMDTALEDMANHTSERFAKGTAEGTAVTSGDGYHDNSKYYKQNAEAWAVGQIDGVDVTSSDARYHNNSKYWSEQSEAASTHAPYIDSTNNHWMVWDTTTSAYTDSGITATGDTGDDAEIIATEYGTSASSSTQPTTWTSTVPTVTGGNYLWTRYTWNNGDYTYMCTRYGVDGSGTGDMTVAVYDSDNAVANAGGIADYVDSRIDSTPTSGSTDAVSSGGVYTALQGKQATLTLDSLLAILPTGINHNGLYRGKALGTITSSNIDSFLTEHTVSAGTFTDLYLGDEIIIQDGTYNATWIIAGFDTEYNKGDTALTTHHVSLIPKTDLGITSAWHASGTPAGYYGSDIWTTCETVATNLANALSSHLLTRRIRPSTAISTTGTSMAGAGFTGYASAWGWQSAQVSLLTEVQVYGATVCSSSFYDVGEANEKLPVFNFLSPCTRAVWWLRSVTSSYSACGVSDYGLAGYSGFTYSLAVRPLICIG